MKFLAALLLPAAFAITAAAEDVRPIPPPGIEIPAADRAEIEAGVKKLGDEIAKLNDIGKSNPLIVRELPNVEIFHKSADWAVRYGEIFDAKQIATAKTHIVQGLERAAALTKGETPWNTATGLVARGYRSKIDGSVQPYGVLVPETWGKAGAKAAPFPLHFWCHGRGEKNTELPFIAGVQANKGEFTPEGAIVCYLFGRYCCANKFAGESDLFEAKADIAAHYPVDERRLVIRGFSMGGAACWQFATHFSGVWAAAAPGAGFAETAEFFKVFAAGKEVPPWWEQVLWRWYDCTTMAANLADTTTIAYSGEIDGQKQAADIMVKYAAQEGVAFPHIIGPNTPHKYHPDSKPKINALVDAAVAKGRPVSQNKSHWTTYTLIYPNSGNPADPIILGMEKEWERADIDLDDTASKPPRIATRNVSRFTWIPSIVGTITVDGQPLPVHGLTNLPRAAVFTKTGGKWSVDSAAADDAGLRKRPGLCGPVDHAFMSRFLFVRPTGKPLNDAIGKWTQSEMAHAIKSWRAVFRGDVPIKDDTAVTDDDIANCNLILWGDNSSNAVIRRIAADPLSSTPTTQSATASKPAGPLLPILWGKNELNFKSYRLDPARYVPILIYPNPLNPARYVVLNSGHTFREFALLNNSDQTPKLPDWALVDITVPTGPKWPGLIYDAGFFDEHWK